MFSEPVPIHLQDSSYYHPDDPRLLDKYAQIGGGWSDAIPFDCSDACSAVTVEILTMDYWCNWSLAWSQVWVEDKAVLEIPKNVQEEVHITCASYRDSRFGYAGSTRAVSLQFLVEQAKKGDHIAFQSLDAVFGGYRKAWRDPYGRFIDTYGDSINRSLSFIDSVCVCTSYTKPVRVYHEYEGYIWKDSLITECYYKADTLDWNHGIVLTNCAQNVQCNQEVWCDIDHCGEGYIYRKFKIWSTCDLSQADSSRLTPADLVRIDSAQHVADTLIREQRIWVSNECPLSKYMFDVPGDTTLDICQITYDDQGNVVGLASPKVTGEAIYKFDDDCRLIGIAHNDRVFKIVGGEQGCYKILRTWYFADWCGYGESTDPAWWKDHELVIDSCVQKIIIRDTISPICEIRGPVASHDTLEVGTCDYHLTLTVEVSDGCGVHHYTYELYDVTDLENPLIYQAGEGSLPGYDIDEFTLDFQGLPHGSYKLKVLTVDDCNNEGFCEYNIDIVAVKKPTPVCITSLTTLAYSVGHRSRWYFRYCLVCDLGRRV